MDATQPALGITRKELNDLVAEAAERGAIAALERIGLHDEKAGNDVRELRSLMGTFRSVKDSMLRSVGFAIMGGIIAGLILLAKVHLISGPAE